MFGKRETELMSLSFSNFEAIDISSLYMKESGTSNAAHVERRHMIESVLYSIYGLSRERNVMHLVKRLSCYCSHKLPLQKLLRRFLAR